MKMRYILVFVCIPLALSLAALSDEYLEDCLQEIEDECPQTEYTKYVNCLRKRQKRSASCQSNDIGCAECDCGSCYDCESSGTCNDCCSTSCCPYSSCKANSCCHKTCHATCQTSQCRSSCRRECNEYVRNGNSSVFTGGTIVVNNTNKEYHNVTTHIHVNNVINNTNVIETPIKINTTNLNNILVALPASHAESRAANQESNCCLVLSPRQCVRTDKFPFLKCFHYRYKMCGPMCYSKVLHTHQIEKQVIYIPQPQPSCSFSQNWPYVSCGTPQRGVNCAGCYDHYFGEPRTPCSNFCYDDGFGAGPYYRQGPVYRPGYSHVPSCVQLGTCGMEAPNNYGIQTAESYPYVQGGYSRSGISYPSIGGYPSAVGYNPNGAGVSYPANGGNFFDGRGLSGVGYSPNTYPYYVVNNPVGLEGGPDNNYEVAFKFKNVSISKPQKVDDLIYNQVAFPYTPLQEDVHTDNISSDPTIEARVSLFPLNKRYAQIEIKSPSIKEVESKNDDLL